MLIATILSFAVIHTIQESRQERYIIPMLVPALVMVILAVREDREKNGVTKRKRWLLYACVIPAVAINLALLPILTLNYSKKGDVEPLALIEKDGAAGSILLFSPEVGRFYPWSYAGFEFRNREIVGSWSDMARLRAPETHRDEIRYAVLYPPDSASLPRYVDSVQAAMGPITEWQYVSPSAIDWTLHLLNPMHNRSNGAWIYRVAKR